MIFANGDCFITYQIKGEIPSDVLSKLHDAFKKFDKSFINEIFATKNSITFSYEPIEIMTKHNTIEPAQLVVDEVESFLQEVGAIK